MFTRAGYDAYPGEHDDTKGALLERLVAEVLAENPDAVTITISTGRPNEESP